MRQITSWDEFPTVEYIPGVFRQTVSGEKSMMTRIVYRGGVVIPEHRHEAEQLGIVITGQVLFTIDGQTRGLGPGGTWRIASDRPHGVTAGPEGAVVIDVFTPVRADWDDLPVVEGATPRWPDAG